MSLAGGLTLTYRGRAGTLDRFVVTVGPNGITTTGARLNGAPVMVDADQALTDDFLIRTEALFGVPVAGDLAPVQTLFSGTAAAQ